MLHKTNIKNITEMDNFHPSFFHMQTDHLNLEKKDRAKL